MSLIRVILQAIRERRLLMFAWSRNDTIHSNCPRCRAPIMLAKVEAGIHVALMRRGSRLEGRCLVATSTIS